MALHRAPEELRSYGERGYLFVIEGEAPWPTRIVPWLCAALLTAPLPAAGQAPGAGTVRWHSVHPSLMGWAGSEPMAYTCGISIEGDLYCWGRALGERAASVPVRLASGAAFADVSGGLLPCAITRGRARCWDLGLQTWGGMAIDSSGPTPVARWVQDRFLLAPPHDDSITLTSIGSSWRSQLEALRALDHVVFTQIGSTARWQCGLSADGAVYCWAAQRPVRQAPDPRTPVAGAPVFRSLTVGGIQVCGLTSAGEAYCWGSGGALGHEGPGTERCFGDMGEMATCRTRPVPVQGGLRFSRLTAGAFHTCGIAADGRAYCWGFNGQGQLGVPRGAGQGCDAEWCRLPVPVSGGIVFSLLAAGGTQTCGLTADGTTYCWGLHDLPGHLPPPDPTCRTSGGDRFDEVERHHRCVTLPVRIEAPPFVQLAVGDRHTCGVTREGEAYCWGSNFVGELGYGGRDHLKATPVRVAEPRRR